MELVKVYTYEDEQGEEIYEVCRYEPKTFKQRQKREGGYIWSLEGVTRVPYKLPQLLQSSPQDWTYIVEGEKDVDRLCDLGITATTTPCGASAKWDEDWNGYFAGRLVAIVPDNDEPGRRHAEEIAEALKETASSVRIVTLPGLKEKGDISDWLDASGTVAELYELTDNAADYLSAQNVSTIENGSGNIELTSLDANVIAAAFEWHSPYKHHYHPTDGWTMYKDGQYQLVSGEQQIMRYLSQFACRCVCVGKKKTERFSPTDSKLHSILTQLSFLPEVGLLPKQTAPCSLDGAIDPKFIIPLKNGLLDWTDHPYVLHPSSPQYYTTNYLPYEWNGERESSKWLSFLVDACSADEELMALLQQWAGYCLMKHNQKEQKFMLLYGEAGTGKSVFVEVLTHLLGLVNIAAIPLDKFDDAHYITGTYGKMLNITDESESRLEESIESHLKHYTGGTVYTFKRMYQEPFTAYPTAKVMIITNHLPDFKDASDGIWRRILLAPFKCQVPAGMVNKNLAKEIVENELPCVLAWALKGARMLNKLGFIEPKICRVELLQYRKESLPEIQFIEENIEGATDHERMNCNELRTKYETWCKTQGVGVKSFKKFARTLHKIYPGIQRIRGRDEIGNLAYFYEKLRFLN